MNDPELRRPRSFANNWISSAGGMIAVIAAVAFLFFVILQYFEGEANPYFGIFMFMVLPPLFLVGIVMVPVGMFRRWRQWKRGEVTTSPYWPTVDFGNPRHRRIVFTGFTAATILVAGGTVLAYHTYHFTESIEFCGRVCHSVMKPEYTTYQNSPHARVHCTACHVGPGAGWFARSKLSGAYQVYAVLANKYPRPIPTPVKNLRPAQETCEQCHWPEKFFGAQQRQFNHYLYDEDNTHWPINMLIKTGGGDARAGLTSGIHWHMNVELEVEYIPRDSTRQEIPWIRSTDNKTGTVEIYQDLDNPLTEEEIKAAKPRKMDCMDCHNRPSHIFPSPDAAVDLALLTDKLDRSLPSIKRAAVEAMTRDYETTQEAMHGIANYITGFYRKRHPEILQNDLAKVDAAILATQNVFSQIIFPEMRVDWSRYPDNIGHFMDPGCMRCHSGRHQTEDGIQITSDCNACHSILSQGSGGLLQMASTQEGLEFRHPEDIGEEWRDTHCHECHDGVQP